MGSISNNSPELSIVILCYRAGESAREFVARIIGVLKDNGIFDYELVLVGNYHNGSDDKTPEVVRDIASKNKKIRFVARVKEGMMGWDMKSGLELAQGNYITVIDGDGQFPVEDVVAVYRKIKDENLDLVKTHRIHRGDSLWRKCISIIYNIFFHLLFPGLNSKDINAKPKIITQEAYNKLQLTSDDWFIDAEIMIQARRLHLKVGEVSTVFLGLVGRRSFVRLKTIFEFMKNLIKYRVKEFLINKNPKS